MKALEYMKEFDKLKEKKGKPLQHFVVKRLRQMANALGWEFIRTDITKNSKRSMKYIMNEVESEKVLTREIIIELK